MANLTNVNRCTQSTFNKIVAGTHATETYDDNAIYEVELDEPISLGAEDSGLSINNNNELVLSDPLPTKVNDRYLHTNASTGALEWSEVAQGGVTSITAGSGLSGNATTGNVTLTVDTNTIQSKISSSNKLSADLISDGSTNKIVTQAEKNTWNNKQDALATQTAYSAKGTSTKVPQITTNTLGQVTGITEVDITKTTLTDLGITATATELNYTDGVTSAIQTQLNNKSSVSVSNTGTATDEVAYIIIDGTEKKIIDSRYTVTVM